MEQKNYMKLVWLFGFIAFATVSCWATAESLHLLLPTWPALMCWIVVVGFFIIASIGTKLIVDSLNQNVFCDNRGRKLICGILLVIVFWGLCSMPTNTHTFFYRTTISDQVTADIATTKSYLNQVLNNQKNEQAAKIQIDALRNRITILMNELNAECHNAANPGFGPKSKEILGKIAVELGVSEIQPLTHKGLTMQDREKLAQAYRNKILTLQKNKEESIKQQITSPSQQQMTQVRAANENLNILKKSIENGSIDLNKAKDIVIVCNKLNEGYAEIKTNKDFINFNNDADREKFNATNPVSDVKRLLSVKDVWQDFLAGKYAGRGFAFWIIISILVDIAAFIFFDLSFKKDV